MNYSVRNATAADLDAMATLMPRLADFDLPARRQPEHLWHEDKRMLERWAAGDEGECEVLVACCGQTLMGVAAIRFRPELLSAAPSAHLELLAVAKSAEGIGIGKALISACEIAARSGGATTLTLHAFATNTRARGLYERLGYDGELLRYIKDL